MSQELQSCLNEYFQFQEYVVLKEGDSLYQEVLNDDTLHHLFIPIEMEDCVGCIVSKETWISSLK